MSAKTIISYVFATIFAAVTFISFVAGLEVFQPLVLMLLFLILADLNDRPETSQQAPSWRIPMSEEQPVKDKLMTMRLVDGEKPLGMEDAIGEYLKEWYTNPYKRAEATATLLVARRTETGGEAMQELFWAGIWYAKKHPEKVVITEEDMPSQRTNTISYVS